MRRAGLACLMLWSLALCLGSSPLWAWSLQRVDVLPAPVAQQLQATADDQPGRERRQLYRLDADVGAADKRMLLPTTNNQQPTPAPELSTALMIPLQ